MIEYEPSPNLTHTHAHRRIFLKPKYHLPLFLSTSQKRRLTPSLTPNKTSSFLVIQRLLLTLMDGMQWYATLKYTDLALADS
ncbi:hypothetical protein COCSUDRAFT_33552 [Coccomyxa subellipsoidea C-169]|uniref:Uncharacterized protein n=1 Tax=Coccomyxa subellipsoidea (strain C-169) TaxID=574566 RepID=I0YTT2_COCSC|nr:hypothetical protein COCSUDRAFT_33552 [Coccomyxa subellipsoidea C-169]EIE21801.1 hypothetical protein COCSUDRAFT_33552 [Coccomyxa subellipsoidea C-169]|eukprot:XP_005646345.1 hypothetical protein COCSUDRAFT_33552 [Coccomyxa subellipsoidea C-169]